MTNTIPKSIPLLKESCILFKTKFSSFFTVIFIAFVAQLLLGHIFIKPFDSTLATFYFVTVIPILSWKNLGLLYIIKNKDRKISFTEPFAKTVKMILPFCLVYSMAMLSVIGGAIFLIIPSLYLAVYLCFSIYTYFFENKKGLNALILSFQYIRGNYITVARRLSFLIILFLLLGGLAEYGIKKVPFNFATSFVYQLTSSLIFDALLIVYAYLLYKNIKDQKSKSDLMADSGKKSRRIIVVTSVIGLAVTISVLSFVIIKYPDSFSYKPTKEESQKMMDLKKKHPWSSNITIKRED